MTIGNNLKQVRIRSSITNESVLLTLGNELQLDSIAPFYESFKHLKLIGPIMSGDIQQPLLSPDTCNDYADDFLYDKQQCLIYFSERHWTSFNLDDAAVFLGYLHVFSVSEICSAMPFLIEIMLRADGWVDSFDVLVAKLRKNARGFKSDLSKRLGIELAGTVVDFLTMLARKAEKYEKYETVTLLSRAIEVWKDNIRQTKQSKVY